MNKFKFKKLTITVLSSMFLLSACSQENNPSPASETNSHLSTEAHMPSSSSLEQTQKSEVQKESSGSPDVSQVPSGTSSSSQPESKAAENSSLPQESKTSPTAASDASAVDGTQLKVGAQSAVVYDSANHKILVSKNEKNLIYPASTVKLMTALLALEHVPLDTVITVGDELDMTQPHSSLAYLAKGQQITMNDLLHALLIPSGNDASYVIAAYTGRVLSGNSNLSAEEAVHMFIGQMNTRAKELGMEHSTYTNPDGFDDHAQQTTAEDLAKLSAEIANHPELTAITRLYTYKATLVSGEVISWTNTNELLNPESPYYIPGCIGLKTGSTEYSGYCIISAYESNGTSYIIAVMNGGKEGRWKDTNLLHDYLTSQTGSNGNDSPESPTPLSSEQS